MNLISVAMFALNVNVDGNSRQARVNGRSDCVGVLWRAVVWCGVVWCGVVCGRCGVVCGRCGGVGGVFRSACFAQGS